MRNAIITSIMFIVLVFGAIAAETENNQCDHKYTIAISSKNLGPLLYYLCENCKKAGCYKFPSGEIASWFKLNSEDKIIYSKSSGGNESWKSYYDIISVDYRKDSSGGKGVEIFTADGESVYFIIVDRDGVMEYWTDNDGKYFKYDKSKKPKNWKYQSLWDSIPEEVFTKRDEFLK